MAAEISFWQTLQHHVRNGHLRVAGTEMMVAAFMMLIAGMLLMGANISELHQIGEHTRHSYMALVKIGDVDGNIMASELSMRGYAMTGEQDYVVRYRIRTHNLDMAMDGLADLLASEPDEAAHLKFLRSYVNARRGLFARLLQMGPDHLAEARRIVVAPNVREERMASGRILYAMRAKELQRVAVRQDAAEHRARQAYILSSAIVLLAFGMVLFGLFLSGHVGSKKNTGERVVQPQMSPAE